VSNKSNMRGRLKIVLGSQTIKAFVAAPKEFHVLGIVRMVNGAGNCMEFGLLATTASGAYVRVNGSIVAALSTEAVEEAMREARNHGRGESYATSRSHIPRVTCTPTVTVRKHRHVVEQHQEALELA